MFLTSSRYFIHCVHRCEHRFSCDESDRSPVFVCDCLKDAHFFGAFRIFHVHRQLLLVAFISQVMVFVNKIFSILSLHQISQNKALIKSSDVHGLYACASPLMHSPVFVDAASILMFTPRNSPHFISSPSPKLFSVFFSFFLHCFLHLYRLLASVFRS